MITNFLIQSPDRGRRSTSDHHSIASILLLLCLTHFPQKICPLIVIIIIIIIVDFVIIVVIIDGGDDDDFQYISNFWDSGRNFGVRPCKYGHTLAII